MDVLFTIQGRTRYEIVRQLAQGGMGTVYEAVQHGACGFTKGLAIKVIRPNFATQKQFIENFIGEAKLVADLIHTNIVQTYQLGEAGGSYYIAMELIRGVNLEQLQFRMYEQQRLLPAEMAIFITSRVARGLAYAHGKTDPEGKPLGIVHRDVSPKNILVAYEGDVKLSDFGIAKARGFLIDNEGEVVAGKADYMSPEQANFEITDKRSDLFSVGVVLAQLLLGRNIFKGENSPESRRNILQMPIPDFRKLDPRIDDRLNQILHHCLVREVQLRFSNADELLYELEHYIYHSGYGPTNETLGKLMREVFGPNQPVTVTDAKGSTRLLEHTVRSARRRPHAS
jgi:serine/threonine-protein kinase